MSADDTLDQLKTADRLPKLLPFLGIFDEDSTNLWTSLTLPW